MTYSLTVEQVSFVASLAHNGVIKAGDVVDAARPEDSPIHHYFTWDDSEAAQKYRLIQARALIQQVKVIVEMPDKVDEIRVYVSMKEDRKNKGGGYRRIVDVLSDEQQRQLLLEQAMEEFARWKAKYRLIKELAEIFEAGERVEMRMLRGSAKEKEESELA